MLVLIGLVSFNSREKFSLSIVLVLIAKIKESAWLYKTATDVLCLNKVFK